MAYVKHVRGWWLAFSLLSGVAAGQAQVTQSDINRLEDGVFQAGSDLRELQDRDSVRADRLRTQLDELREEVIYLKVKLRKEGSVARAEYADVRDRIEDLRTLAQNNPPTAAPVARASVPEAPGNLVSPNVVPAGTEMDVRLSGRLNSGTAVVEDRFEATTLFSLSVDGRLLIPKGAVMRGVVSDVQPGTRTNRTARMTLSFDQITFEGRAFPLRGTLTKAIEGEGLRDETTRTAAGAGVGAIIGGLLGGVRGALVGVLVGGGGTVAATEGEEVDLPQGTTLRVRIDAPLEITR